MRPVVDGATGCECDATALIRRGRSCLVYNECAFHYFLRVEIERAQRSARPLLLVVLHLPALADGYVRVPPTIAPRLVWALADCIRDIDFIGWYRSGRVIAAVLTDVCWVDRASSWVLRTRLRESIARQLTSHLLESVRVHMWPIGARIHPSGAPRDSHP
jgi:hypothetical protein